MAFTENQEKLLIEEGIKKGYVKVNETAKNDYFKYQWESITDKYKIYIELKDNENFNK